MPPLQMLKHLKGMILRDMFSVICPIDNSLFQNLFQSSIFYQFNFFCESIEFFNMFGVRINGSLSAAIKWVNIFIQTVQKITELNF